STASPISGDQGRRSSPAADLDTPADLPGQQHDRAAWSVWRRRDTHRAGGARNGAFVLRNGLSRHASMDRMAPTVALVNEKGGVGKTAVTLGLASAAWAADDRVLVVDLDPQGAATWMLGVEPHDGLLSAAELITGGRRPVGRDAVITSAWGEQVDLIPAVPGLTELGGIAREA